MGYECAICSKNVEEDGRFCEIGISVDGLMKTINWRYQEDVSISLCPKHLAELKRILQPLIKFLGKAHIDPMCMLFEDTPQEVESKGVDTPSGWAKSFGDNANIKE